MALDDPNTATFDALGLTILPCGPVLGAEVAGVHIDAPVAPEIAAALRALLRRYKVLFLRDLDLSHEQHLALGRVWGELEGHPVISHVPGYPEILDIRGSDGRVEDEGAIAGSRRSTSGTPTSPSGPHRRWAPCCARATCRRSAATRCGRMRRRPIRACPTR